MRFGDRIGITTAQGGITSVIPVNIGTIAHELLHAMGLGHPEVGVFEEQAVPGTQNGVDFRSIMHSSTDDPLRANSLQVDDLQMLVKLYSGNCAYSPNFRLITP